MGSTSEGRGEAADRTSSPKGDRPRQSAAAVGSFLGFLLASFVAASFTSPGPIHDQAVMISFVGAAFAGSILGGLSGRIVGIRKGLGAGLLVAVGVAFVAGLVIGLLSNSITEPLTSWVTWGNELLPAVLGGAFMAALAAILLHVELPASTAFAGRGLASSATLGGLVGGFVGMLGGSLASAMTTATGGVAFGVVDATRGGMFLGAWVGALVGLLVSALLGFIGGRRSE